MISLLPLLKNAEVNVFTELDKVKLVYEKLGLPGCIASIELHTYLVASLSKD